MKMYELSITDTTYKYTKNNSFKNKRNDVKIVATRNLEIGQDIKTLCGQTAIIKPECGLFFGLSIALYRHRKKVIYYYLLG